MGYRGVVMQDLANVLPRIPIPRTSVNKDKRKGWGFGTPALSIQNPLCTLPEVDSLDASSPINVGGEEWVINCRGRLHCGWPPWNGLSENPLTVKAFGPAASHVPENDKSSVL